MSKNSRIAIGGDHAGFEYKKRLMDWLIAEGFEVEDFGPYTDESVDYPDFIHPLCEAIETGRINRGLIICGSGNGVAMTANKHQGIRAAVCWNEELAVLSRGHNDANLLSIPARFVSFEMALKMASAFLETPFEGGRHERRVNKIRC